MLKQLEIANYRCFPSLKVELRPLTVLIGPNNTGKSAFLDAIRALCPPGNGPDQFAPCDTWRLNAESTIEIRGSLSASDQEVSVQGIGPQGKKLMRVSQLNGLSFFRLPSSGIKCESQGFPESVQELPMEEQGQNLASVLDFMLRKDRKRFDGVTSTLRKLIPGFEDLSVDTPNPAIRNLGVVLDNGLKLQGDSLSVGLRHLIFFATLAYHPRAPQIILVEEPELGVHPKRLADIMNLLRNISNGDYCDHPAQVVLTTHSPFLLDHVDLDCDQLLIFQREESTEGARTASPADKDRLRVFLDEFMLGEVWLNEEETGLIGR